MHLCLFKFTEIWLDFLELRHCRVKVIKRENGDGIKVFARLTVDNPLHPPNAKSDDEADGIPGAAGPVGHRGGHHGGQGQDDDSAIKHLSGSDNRSTFLEAIVSKYSNLA